MVAVIFCCFEKMWRQLPGFSLHVRLPFLNVFSLAKLVHFSLNVLKYNGQIALVRAFGGDFLVNYTAL